MNKNILTALLAVSTVLGGLAPSIGAAKERQSQIQDIQKYYKYPVTSVEIVRPQPLVQNGGSGLNGLTTTFSIKTGKRVKDSQYINVCSFSTRATYEPLYFDMFLGKTRAQKIKKQTYDVSSAFFYWRGTPKPGQDLLYPTDPIVTEVAFGGYYKIVCSTTGAPATVEQINFAFSGKLKVTGQNPAAQIPESNSVLNISIVEKVPDPIHPLLVFSRSDNLPESSVGTLYRMSLGRDNGARRLVFSNGDAVAYDLKNQNLLGNGFCAIAANDAAYFYEQEIRDYIVPRLVQNAPTGKLYYGIVKHVKSIGILYNYSEEQVAQYDENAKKPNLFGDVDFFYLDLHCFGPQPMNLAAIRSHIGTNWVELTPAQ